MGVESSGYFIDIGLPETLARARRELPRLHQRPALFLDRDGVLNVDAGYTHKVEDLRWMEGATEAIRHANDCGALVIVVTNQAGIARGYYDLGAVKLFHDAMQEDLARVGGHIDGFYICAHHPEATVECWRHPDHPDRKPNPGMINRALAEWPIDIKRCAMVGDREIDMESARRAGIASFLFTGGDLRSLIAPIVEGWAKLS